ncbi:MAG: exo-alpha-sialidase [Phycisphaerae bacterium]|nr:exo-alpha-sialidase [Phycisphaerae bacterium]
MAHDKTRNNVSRRTFLKTSGVASTAVLLGTAKRSDAAQAAKIIETKVISHEPHYYHGWPTVARRRNGQLLAVWSGGRKGHVCPFGRVEYMTSNDNGKTWTWPRVLLDSGIDDRDAGVLETAKGSILVTTFSSLAYEPILAKAEQIKPGEKGAWPAAKLQDWQAAHNRLTPEQRKAELGQYMLRSTDGGVTWSARYPSVVNSPHGPVQLSDGRLLYPGKELWTGQKRVGVCESSDDGVTWKWLAEIPARPGDTPENYHELHGVETADGRLLVQIRNHNKESARETLQTESSDGGKTWAVPRSIGVWGLPSFLTRLRNGHLLMTYGHRRAPLGNQARVSTDHGRTWSEPIIVSGDGVSGDLGYPSTVELDGGTLLTLWYENMRGSSNAVLRQATWKLGA